MHILANMRSKTCIKGRLIISSKFVTIWVTTKNNKGEGGSKIGNRLVTCSLNGPLIDHLHQGIPRMKFLSAQDKQGLTVSKHYVWKNLMGHDSKEENFNGSSLTFLQFCWVMVHFWIFEKCGPTPSYVLFMTTP